MVASADPVDISKAIPERVRVFLREIRSGDLWIVSPRTHPLRDPMIAFAVIESEAAVASGLSLSRVIDSRFDRDDRLDVDRTIGTPCVLVFSIDDVGDHKKTPSVMDSVISGRVGTGFPTVYVTDVDIRKHVGRYGAGACGFFSSFRESIKIKNGPTVYVRKS